MVVLTHIEISPLQFSNSKEDHKFLPWESKIIHLLFDKIAQVRSQRIQYEKIVAPNFSFHASLGDVVVEPFFKPITRRNVTTWSI